MQKSGPIFEQCRVRGRHASEQQICQQKSTNQTNLICWIFDQQNRKKSEMKFSKFYGVKKVFVDQKYFSKNLTWHEIT